MRNYDGNAGFCTFSNRNDWVVFWGRRFENSLSLLRQISLALQYILMRLLGLLENLTKQNLPFSIKCGKQSLGN